MVQRQNLLILLTRNFDFLCSTLDNKYKSQYSGDVAVRTAKKVYIICIKTEKFLINNLKNQKNHPSK